MQHLGNSPVSHRVNILRLPQKGLPVKIVADADQRAALAKAHGLLDVRSFEAEIFVSTWKRNGLKVTGQVDAVIDQECVVTLEPLEARISEEFSQVFLPEDSKLAREGFHVGGEILLDAEGPDSPEPFSGDVIDVGALAEEFFGLAIDPYPRKPGVELEAETGGDDEESSGPLQEKLLSFTRKT